MPEDKLSDKEIESKIQEALERINLSEMPEDIANMIRFFADASNDEIFIENLQKEIVKKYGE